MFPPKRYSLVKMSKSKKDYKFTACMTKHKMIKLGNSKLRKL